MIYILISVIAFEKSKKIMVVKRVILAQRTGNKDIGIFSFITCCLFDRHAYKEEGRQVFLAR